MNQNDHNFLIQKIRTQYTEKEHTDLDELKTLDTKVKRPANLFAYTFGSIGAIVMGSGMSLIMTDLGKALGTVLSMVIGISAGIVGVVLVCLAYPVYNRILQKEREKIAPEVLRLTDELMK